MFLNAVQATAASAVGLKAEPENTEASEAEDSPSLTGSE